MLKFYAYALSPVSEPGSGADLGENQQEYHQLILERVNALLPRMLFAHIDEKDERVTLVHKPGLIMWLTDTVTAQGIMKNFAHPAIKETIIEFYYKGKRSLAAYFPEEFKAAVPIHIVALVVTAVSKPTVSWGVPV